MYGIYPLAVPTICHHTGMTAEAVHKCFEAFAKIKFAYYDVASETVFVVEMANYQIAESLVENDNRHIGLLKDLQWLSKLHFFELFYARYRVPYSLPDEGLGTPSEGASEGLGRGFQAPPKPRTRTRTRTRARAGAGAGAGAGARTGAGTTVNQTADPPIVELPQILDTPAFRESWGRWVRYRGEIKKPLSDTTVQAQLKMLAQWGPEKGARALERSVTNGWTGLFDPDDGGSANGRQTRVRPGSRGPVAEPGKYDNLRVFEVQKSPPVEPAVADAPAAQGPRVGGDAGGPAGGAPPADGR
jgi:hypothetical protein